MEGPLMRARSLESQRVFSTLECNVCLAKKAMFPVRSNTLSKCSGCHLLWYCKKEHQRDDWPMHREFCRAIQQLMRIHKVIHPLEILFEVRCKDDLEVTIDFLKQALSKQLGRSLRFYEQQLLSFPGHCALCFGLYGLKPCRRCFAVAYCCDSHAALDAARHAKVCYTLILYYCPFTKKTMKMPYYIDVKYRIPSLLATNLYRAIGQSARVQLSANPMESFRSFQLYSAAADFSCVATICYAMEYLRGIYPSNKRLLAIYVVGATPDLTLWFREQHTKFIFVQYPHVQLLKIFFIGPAVVDVPERTYAFAYMGMLRIVKLIVFPQRFQLFTMPIIKPCMVVAFNCDFAKIEPMPGHQVDYKSATYRHMNLFDWLHDLKAVLKLTYTPFLFTSFTQFEAMFDYMKVRQVAETLNRTPPIKRYINFFNNPYFDLRPKRNMRTLDEEPIYYRNGYAQLIVTAP